MRNRNQRSHDLANATPAATTACYASIKVINLRFCLLTLLSMGPFLEAQVPGRVISVDDGKQVRAVARLVDNRWVGERWCTPAGSQSAESRDRITVSGDLRIVATRAVGPGSAEWLRLTPTIVESFERREKEQRLLSDKTSDAPRAIDWVYSEENADRRMYYFEASRRVSSPVDPDNDTDPPGTVRIAVAGFLHDTGGRLVSLGTKGELRWEQDGLPAGPRRPDLTPLGIVVHGGQSIWVMKGQSGTSVWFTLYDVSSTGIRTILTTRGVHC